MIPVNIHKAVLWYEHGHAQGLHRSAGDAVRRVKTGTRLPFLDHAAWGARRTVPLLRRSGSSRLSTLRWCRIDPARAETLQALGRGPQMEPRANATRGRACWWKRKRWPRLNRNALT